MAVRRIAEEQPESFAFDAGNLAWAKAQIAKYPEGKQASAVIPLLWRAQEQHNGWLPEPAMRYVAEMLLMPYIRVLEVATFYTMFQLKPVGSVAHIQVCGTTPCMLRGSEGILEVCKRRISAHQHEVTADGRFSWEEVECLGACVNAPMVQIFKDAFEDLTPETFEKMLDDMEKGRPVKPGPQVERHLSVNQDGRTQLFDDSMDYGAPADPHIAPYAMNGAAAMIASDARAFGIANDDRPKAARKAPAPTAGAKTAPANAVSEKTSPAKMAGGQEDADTQTMKKPRGLAKPRKAGADDLKRIKGVGKVIEEKLNAQGIFHFDQIAKWGAPEIRWFDDFLSFSGRIDRDGWVGQAAILGAGGETEFSKRADRGEVPSSAGGAPEKPGKGNKR